MVRTPINEQCYQLFCLFDLTHDRLGGGGSRGVITVFMLFWFPVSQVVGIVTIAHTQIRENKRNQKNKNKTLIHRSIHALVVP